MSTHPDENMYVFGEDCNLHVSTHPDEKKLDGILSDIYDVIERECDDDTFDEEPIIPKVKGLKFWKNAGTGNRYVVDNNKLSLSTRRDSQTLQEIMDSEKYPYNFRKIAEKKLARQNKDNLQRLSMSKVRGGSKDKRYKDRHYYESIYSKSYRRNYRVPDDKTRRRNCQRMCEEITKNAQNGRDFCEFSTSSVSYDFGKIEKIDWKNVYNKSIHNY